MEVYTSVCPRVLYGVLLQTSRARGREAGVRARAHFFFAALGFLTAPFLGPLSALGAPRLAGGSSTSSSGAVYTCARGDAWRVCARAHACARVDETVCVRVCARVRVRPRACDRRLGTLARANVFARSHLELLLEELDVLRVGRVNERERVARAARRLQRGVAVERVDDLRVGARLLRLAEAQLAVQRRAPVYHLRRRGRHARGRARASGCASLHEPTAGTRAREARAPTRTRTRTHARVHTQTHAQTRGRTHTRAHTLAHAP